MFGGRGDKRFDDLLVGDLNALLPPLLVNEVDEVVVAVEPDLLVKVLARGVKGDVNAADLQCGDELEVVDFSPVDGDGSTGLDVGEDLDALRVQLASRGRARDGVLVVALAAQAASAVAEDHNLLRLVKVGGIAHGVQAAREIASAGTVTRPAGEEDECARRALDGRGENVQEAEEDRQDIRVDGRAGGAQVDQVGLDIAIPEKAVVGALPQREREVHGGLALEAGGQIEGVGEVHGAGAQVGAEEGEIGVLIGIVELALTEGEELGRLDLVDGMSADTADELGLGDDDDVLVCSVKNVSFMGGGGELGAGGRESYQVSGV